MLLTREELRQKIQSNYSFTWHVLSIHAVAFAFVGVALAFVRDLRPDELLAVPATFLFANGVEYVAHRYPMHHRMRPLAVLFDRHTATHHAFFRSDTMRVEGVHEMRYVLFPAWAAALALAVASPFGLSLAYFSGLRNTGLLYVATSAAYYLLYEWLHASYHLFPDALARWPVLAKAAARHRRHHDPEQMTRVNFNITFPIVDKLVGTCSPEEA